MSIKKKYFDYLRHFGNAVSLQEFRTREKETSLVGLRHDVDHDLDAALEMSFWEKDLGVSATYFILPTANYWEQDGFFDKIRQIHEFGHEIGLHVNILAQWMQGHTDDPAQSLQEQLTVLRKTGIPLKGISAHGDKLCYENHFINYWLFNGLRPPDPVSRESGLNAEGLPALPGEKQILYPAGHYLTRSDGCKLPLWSISMQDLGIEYDAVHLPCDLYFTDSGGDWKRSPDPLQQDLSTGRYQILIHPEYWCGRQKMYFFLSAARSGSKWLSTLLDQATPLTARHEFSLNHHYKESTLVHEHMTGPGFTTLDQDKKKARELLLDIRNWIEEHGRDYGEANIYLERFLLQLEEVFTDAVLVHLHRNPADVVRSIINRDWYDTPQDDRHPRVDIAGWASMNRFEKSCWYVRAANEKLMPLKAKICFEKMVSDLSGLEHALKGIGIPFYPVLAGETFSRKINANKKHEFPNADVWPEKLNAVFKEVCGPVGSSLAYDTKHHCRKDGSNTFSVDFLIDLLARPAKNKAPVVIAHMDFSSKNSGLKITEKFCIAEQTNAGLQAVPPLERHSYILLGGGQWAGLETDAGWKSTPGHYYSGTVRAALSGAGTVQVFCLMYDNMGELSDKKLLKRIKAGQETCDFSFRVKPNAPRFNLALYFNKDDLPETFVLKHFRLLMFSWDSNDKENFNNK
jgi:hypothetical protein